MLLTINGGKHATEVVYLIEVSACARNMFNVRKIKLINMTFSSNIKSPLAKIIYIDVIFRAQPFIKQ